LLLLGRNLDLWSYALIDKAVSQFGKLIVWEEDHNHMSRALVKARVTSLDAIPWFLNFSEGEDPESDSWTVQTEIIMARMLGAMPQDENFPPDDPDDVNPNAFDFFGFGQPGQGPPPPPGQNVNQANVADPAWDPWINPNTAHGDNLAAQQGLNE
jgi:hypothetical protein